MVRRNAHYVLQLMALIGVAMSGWLLVQYMLPESASICGPHGGCNAVRNCGLAKIGPEWMPFWPSVGLLSFSALMVLSLSSRRVVQQRLLPWTAIAGGVMGVGLIVAQRVACHAFCQLCLVTDSAAFIAAIAAFIMLRKARNEATPESYGVHPAMRWGYTLIAIGSVIGSFYYGVNHVGPVRGQQVELPAVLAREQRSGTATLVEFSDFECPYCRRQNSELSEVLPSYGSRVRLVRKHVPLHMHEHAEDAARAACCVEEQGHGDAMADLLFRSEDLTPAGCEHSAQTLGVDLNAYHACLNAPRTSARIATDRSAATEADVHGLPTMFIGTERFDGVVPASTLRNSIDRVLRAAGADPGPHT